MPAQVRHDPGSNRVVVALQGDSLRSLHTGNVHLLSSSTRPPRRPPLRDAPPSSASDTWPLCTRAEAPAAKTFLLATALARRAARPSRRATLMCADRVWRVTLQERA